MDDDFSDDDNALIEMAENEERGKRVKIVLKENVFYTVIATFNFIWINHL